jgi:hypothetical protein
LMYYPSAPAFQPRPNSLQGTFILSSNSPLGYKVVRRKTENRFRGRLYSESPAYSSTSWVLLPMGPACRSTFLVLFRGPGSCFQGGGTTPLNMKQVF